MKPCGDCAAKAPSKGITTSSRTPSPAIRSALASSEVSSFGAEPGATTARGCGSKVSAVSAPRITSRCPMWTPSNSPTATWRGPALGVREPGDVQAGFHLAAEAYDGLERAVLARLGQGDEAVAVEQAHRARGRAGHRRRPWAARRAASGSSSTAGRKRPRASSSGRKRPASSTANGPIAVRRSAVQ